MSHKTEELLKTANSTSRNDTSVNAAKRIFTDENEARSFFETAAPNLCNVDVWNRCAAASEYAVFDDEGREIHGVPMAAGRFLRIHLHGSGKYDWVRMIEIKRHPDEVVLTVEPSYDPTQKPVDTSVISHFFSDDGRNNFCLQLDGKSVSFYVVGIGEKQNSQETEGIVETARNVATANLGYYLGIQKAEWKTFCKNFLEISADN